MGRQRYEGVQTFLKDGCYFLSLCSIAEDETGCKVDIIAVVNETIRNKWATPDGFINNPCAILKWLTKNEWKLRVEDKIPIVVKDNEYTVLKYYNKRTGFTHFKRRDVDTLIDSVTVKEGVLKNCYVFEVL